MKSARAIFTTLLLLWLPYAVLGQTILSNLSGNNYSFNSPNTSWTATFTCNVYQGGPPLQNWVWNWYFNGNLVATTYFRTNTISLTKPIGTSGNLQVRIDGNGGSYWSSTLSIGNTSFTYTEIWYTPGGTEWAEDFQVDFNVDGHAVGSGPTYQWWRKLYVNGQLQYDFQLYTQYVDGYPNRTILDGNHDKNCWDWRFYTKVIFPGATFQSNTVYIPEYFGHEPCQFAPKWSGGPAMEKRFTTDATPVDGYALLSNYPNPFNPETQISFTLPEQARVDLYIYDILGRMVSHLVSGEFEAGVHSVNWKAENASGGSLTSGIYICRIEAVGESGKTYLKSSKLVLQK